MSLYVLRNGRFRPVVAGGGNYPQSVIDKGLQAVWDLATTVPAGIGAPNKFLPGDASLLPGGAGTLSGTTITPPNGANYQSWDLRGYYLAIDGNIGVQASDTLFQPPNGGGLVIELGVSAGAPSLTLTRCKIDGTGGTKTFASIFMHRRGDLTLNDSWLLNFPITTIYKASSGNLSAAGNLFRAPGKLAQGPGTGHDDHCEVFFFAGNGNNILSSNLFDLSDYAGEPATLTSVIYFEDTGAGDAAGTVSQCITKGLDVSGITDYSVQIAQKYGGTNVTSWNNNVLDKGPPSGGQHFVVSAISGTPTVNKTGNVDLDTAAAIP